MTNLSSKSLARVFLASTFVSMPLSTVSCYDGHEFPLDVDAEDTPVSTQECGPLMTVFPVGEAHNIGYDQTDAFGNDPCAGGCPVSCPDARANSDWNITTDDHHGIDIFARHRAPLLAVADGTVRVDHGNATSGNFVKLKDDCQWSYYYGHLDEYVVEDGQRVAAGQLIGYMGSTGAQSDHLHFNVSPEGYYDDIDPLDMLIRSSPTACGVGAAVPRYATQNEEHVIGFTHGASTCDFSFMHGTFLGAAYAKIMPIGDACAKVVTTVTTAIDADHIYSKTSEIDRPEWVQATGETGSLLGADYCVETSDGGSLVFGYDAFTNALRDQAVRDRGC